MKSLGVFGLRPISVITIFLCLSNSATAGDLTIELTGLRNSNGQIIISLFDNQKNFEAINDKYHTIFSTIANGNSSQIIIKDFPEGEYAFVAIHDENRDNDLNINIWGSPQEGFVYSNNKVGIADVTFKEASFIHKKGTALKQAVEMNYFQ